MEEIDLFTFVRAGRICHSNQERIFFKIEEGASLSLRGAVLFYPNINCFRKTSGKRWERDRRAKIVIIKSKILKGEEY